MEFNLSSELLNGLIVGFASGIISAVIISWIIIGFMKRNQRKILRKKYSKAEGSDYKTYSFDDIVPSDTDDYPQIQKKTIRPNGGKAEIKYEHDNMLSISLTEKDGSVWEGKMIMEMETIGSVYYRYTHLPFEDKWHWYGFRRFMIRDEAHHIYIYLDEEINSGLGKEVLIRRKK